MRARASDTAIGLSGQLRSGSAARNFESFAYWGLIGGLAWVPFLLGSNIPFAWGLNALFFPGLVLVYELSLLLRNEPHPVSISRIAGPAILFGAVFIWIAAQNLTWLPGWFKNPVWQMTAEVLGAPVHGSISVNRDATEVALMRLLTVAAVFWLSLQLSREPTRAVGLLKSIAFLAVVYTVYGFIAVVVLPGRTLWFENIGAYGFVQSTFYNRNSYATYAGIGLVLLAALTLQQYRTHAVSSAAPLKYRVAAILETTAKESAWMLAGLFILFVGLLGTASRGGLFSTIFALFAYAVLSGRSKSRSRERRLTLGVVAVVIAVTFVAFGDEVVGRVAESGLGDPARLEVWRTVVESLKASPLLGFGYGTFADTFPMFRDNTIPMVGRWVMAHNTYLEVLQGLGLAGGAMLIAAMGLLLARCLKGVITRRATLMVPTSALAVGLLVGLTSLVDFSLQIQAVAVTTMAILGAGTAQSFSSRISTAD